MSYTDLIKIKNSLTIELESLKEAYKKNRTILENKLLDADRDLRAAEAGNDMELFKHGRELIEVCWSKCDDRELCSEIEYQFKEAIDDIRKGVEKMRTHYFGVKSYSGWAAQLCDCAYGFGPTHGSVWFSIGLRNPQRDVKNFTEQDMLAMVHYLNAVKKDPDLL